ncbi:hypothetical protein NHX12_024621 [Muraenolepis orangiensis]|uniref:Uncharacterized protein n=1 Tax=Muraenolepis orangiensis TaxID=630683 RepID=A0A9Q0IRH2_9TELE|nr:hypothetical protein NHX12_024621 [Muraenolepis orangiensis]
MVREELACSSALSESRCPLYCISPAGLSHGWIFIMMTSDSQHLSPAAAAAAHVSVSLPEARRKPQAATPHQHHMEVFVAWASLFVHER